MNELEEERTSVETIITQIAYDGSMDGGVVLGIETSNESEAHRKVKINTGLDMECIGKRIFRMAEVSSVNSWMKGDTNTLI